MAVGVPVRCAMPRRVRISGIYVIMNSVCRNQWLGYAVNQRQWIQFKNVMYSLHVTAIHKIGSICRHFMFLLIYLVQFSMFFRSMSHTHFYGLTVRRIFYYVILGYLLTSPIHYNL